MTRKWLSLCAAVIVMSATAAGQFGAVPADESPIAREVRHEILTLPLYSVFDDVKYQVNGNEVTLGGWVTRPVLKTVIGKRVAMIPGVEKVDNQVTVLPLLSSDNALRIQLYNTIYGNFALQRYAYNSVPPIRIIVNFGRVTLDGVVNTKLDKRLAVTQASLVPGVLGKITDDLRVDPNG